MHYLVQVEVDKIKGDFAGEQSLKSRCHLIKIFGFAQRINYPIGFFFLVGEAVYTKFAPIFPFSFGGTFLNLNFVVAKITFFNGRIQVDFPDVTSAFSNHGIVVNAVAHRNHGKRNIGIKLSWKPMILNEFVPLLNFNAKSSCGIIGGFGLYILNGPSVRIDRQKALHAFKTGVFHGTIGNNKNCIACC